MVGFDLRVRIDTLTGVASAEVLLIDGSRDVLYTAPIDGSFVGFANFLSAAVSKCNTNWQEAMYAWSTAWPTAATREGVELLEELAKDL